MYLIFLIIALLAVYFLLSSLYQKRWDRALDLRLAFGNSGVFEGEQGEIVETLTNRKLLPVFSGTIQFKTSCRLRIGESAPDHDYYRQDTISAFSFEEVIKRIPFTAERRGFYCIEDAQIVAVDLFFTAKLLRSFHASDEIYVYPNVKDTGRFQIDFKKVVGDVTARRNMVEDPFFFRGIRDYSPSDSIKKVNWNATARSGGLKVNEFHSTRSQEVMLLLDLDGYNNWDGQEIKEDVIRIAAMLAQRLVKNGIAVGLKTNAADIISGGIVEERCKGGFDHYFSLLRKMARLDTGKLTSAFGSILESLSGKGSSSTQYILISYYSGAELIRRFTQLEAAGISIQWILVKDKSRGIEFTKRRGVYICEVEN
jgi:uncharacterized protein (DUF58 family)